MPKEWMILRRWFHSGVASKTIRIIKCVMFSWKPIEVFLNVNIVLPELVRGEEWHGIEILSESNYIISGIVMQ